MFLNKLKERINPKDHFPGILPINEQKRIASLPRCIEGETTIFGDIFRFSDSFGFMHSLKELFVDRTYEFHSKSNNSFIVDVGANYGLSLLFFKQIYPESRILSFEPDPDIYELLKSNISCMSNSTNIEARNTAAWIEACELKFYQEGSLSGSSMLDTGADSRVCTVKAERLRDALRESEQIDFLKIDIEGAENVVVFDLIDILPKVECLFVEYHGVPGERQRLGEILDLIADAGFRYSVRDASPLRHNPFTEVPLGTFDPQLNIFARR